MLYATTRDPNDIHTAYKSIHLDCSRDGGLFVPFSMPKVDFSHIDAMKDRSFGENVADILNIFFAAGLTGFDLDFAIGKNSVQNVVINNRLILCECWHNSHWQFAYIEQALSDKLRKENFGQLPANWVQLAVRIAVIFGVYGSLLSEELISSRDLMDISVTAGDFAMPMACWYAREMGLPVGNIVCGCNSNGTVWDLLHRGQVNPSATVVNTCTPAADMVLPRNLERLICATCAPGEVSRYLDSVQNGTIYNVDELSFDQLREGFFASVNSDSRVVSLISNFYRTNHYVLSPYAALAYGSLTDYRAKTGESRTAVVISECSPVRDDGFVASAMDISVPELEKILHLA